jgi:hypothetical protein
VAQKLKRVVLTLAVVLGGGWLYSLMVVPLVEGQAIKTSRRTQFLGRPPAERDDSECNVGQFLPGLDELILKKRLSFDRGSVHFSRWETTPEGRLEASPFMMLLHQEEQAERGTLEAGNPVVLYAPEGAVLEFDEEFKDSLAPSGKLVGAILRGEVTIYRAASGEGREQLDVKTKNIQIASNKIFTPHPVEFQLGKHRGRGSNLEIELETAAASEGGKIPAVQGIKTLELVKVDYLRFAVPQKGSGIPTTGGTDPSPESSYLDVRCDGSFVCNMEEQAARLENHVQVVHLTEQGEKELESLECQDLIIQFDQLLMQSPGSRIPPKEAVKNDAMENGQESDFSIRRMIAQGQPAVLHSSLREFHAEADTISYDPVQQSVSMRDDRLVILTHRDLRFEAPEFDYQLSEGKRLGTAVAEGQGRVSRLPGEHGPGFSMQWSEQLQLRPHEGLQCLSFYGNPQLSVATGENFRSEELHVWLSDESKVVTAPPNQKKTNRIELVKLLAERNVAIDSPKLGGKTERLEVFWDPDTALNRSVENEGANQPLMIRSETASTGPVPVGVLPSSQENAPRKLIVSGDFIRARLKPNQDSFAVEEITVDGNARLFERRSEQSLSEAAEPLMISGKLLQVNALGADFFSAYVVAEAKQQNSDPQPKPVLAARGMELFGTQMQLNQAQHRMWMEGAGEAHLHSQSKPQASQQMTGPAIVRWQGGLDFDGEWVRVRDAVNIWIQTVNPQGIQSTVQIQSEGMDLRLTHKVDLTGGHQGTPSSTGTSQKEDIETLILHGQVWITHWEVDQQGTTQAVDRLFALGAGLHYPTGNLIAGGPGFAQSIRLQSGESPISSVNTPSDSAASDSGLTHFRIEFHREIQGNIYDKHLAFVEQVQVYSAPVSSWDSWLERGELLKRADLVYLRCDQLTTDEIIVERHAPTSWLVQAMGNAYLAGQGIEASASRMTYDQGKDLLTLVADDRDDAQLSRQTQPGAQRDLVRAREIKFWRATNQVEVAGISSLSSNAQFGGRQPPSPNSNSGGRQ